MLQLNQVSLICMWTRRQNTVKRNCLFVCLFHLKLLSHFRFCPCSSFLLDPFIFYTSFLRTISPAGFHCNLTFNQGLIYNRDGMREQLTVMREGQHDCGAEGEPLHSRCESGIMQPRPGMVRKCGASEMSFKSLRLFSK